MAEAKPPFKPSKRIVWDDAALARLLDRSELEVRPQVLLSVSVSMFFCFVKSNPGAVVSVWLVG